MIPAPETGRLATPRFRAIFEILRDEIRSGKLPVGTRLATEQELCLRFASSRHTVREALRLLQEQGYVNRRQGAGTTIVSREPTDGFFNSISSLEQLVQYASMTELEILSIETLLIDETLASLLRGAAGDAWTRIAAMRRAPGEDGPICYSEIFLPVEFAAVASEVGRRRTAVYAILEEMFDIRIAEVSQSLEAAAADANEASRLGIAAGDPVLHIMRHYTDQEGRTVEVSRNVHPAGRYRYRMVLQRG